MFLKRVKVTWLLRFILWSVYNIDFSVPRRAGRVYEVEAGITRGQEEAVVGYSHEVIYAPVTGQQFTRHMLLSAPF
jgi:signal recognition particle subunit SEC65